MGGDRPRNHVPARYVTVIDRAEGCVKYFYLDAKGCLIFEQGVPKLCKCERFRISASPPDPEPMIEAEAEVLPPLADPLDAHEDFPGFGESLPYFYGGNPDPEFSAYEGWNPFLM
jgi:hypothetical protein